MAIKRYYANADNTITNAFRENLTIRGTGSNMGASHVLETFSIYGQTHVSSSELSRILIKFPMTEIDSDRTDNLIPASGSVKYYLKMYDARHGQSVPTNYSISVYPITNHWEEGHGLDMENYEDDTNNGVGSNWINRTGDNIAEITKFTFSSSTPSDYGAGSGANYIQLYDSDSLYNFWFNDGAGDSAGSGAGTWKTISINGLGSSPTIAEAFKSVVNGLSGFSAQRGTGGSESIVYVTASTAGASLAAVTEVGTISGLSAEVLTTGTNATAWTTPGGDYSDAPLAEDGFAKEQFFSKGTEDLEIDISSIVENWLDSSDSAFTNYGLMVKITGSLEDAAKSYYTKRFFGKDSEFYYKRPVIEARWNDAEKDNRGDFFLSSSTAPASTNTNTLYFRNYSRGALTNLNSQASNIYVSFHSASDAGTSSRILVNGSNTAIAVTASATGVYKCNVVVTGTLSTIYDKWYTVSNVYKIGTINTKTNSPLHYEKGDDYVLSMPKLKKQYKKDQNIKLRLYVRDKNWSPNIYTTATRTSIPSTIITSGSYKIMRDYDDLVIVQYGTGSTTNHTHLSHDVSGNYFYLDTSFLEAGYQYKIKYSFYDGLSKTYLEQPYEFKFRVVK